MDEKVIVTNIQRFSLQDGPGIRTTVFLKGCNLRCPWCSNPENLKFEIEEYCTEEEKGTYGYEVSLEQLYKEIIKDKQYYETDGGVTFSGGECLFQFKRLEPLLKELKANNINICVETALTVPTEMLSIALKYVDLFYVDMKILDELASEKIKGNVELYKRNLHKLDESNKKYIIRIPLVIGYTYTEKNIKCILELLEKLKPLKVEIFKVHNLAEKKYKSLKMNQFHADDFEEDKIKGFKDKIEKVGINCDFIKI